MSCWENFHFDTILPIGYEAFFEREYISYADKLIVDQFIFHIDHPIRIMLASSCRCDSNIGILGPVWEWFVHHVFLNVSMRSTPSVWSELNFWLFFLSRSIIAYENKNNTTGDLHFFRNEFHSRIGFCFRLFLSHPLFIIVSRYKCFFERNGIVECTVYNRSSLLLLLFLLYTAT